MYIINQAKYISKMKPVPKVPYYSHFRSLRVNLAWFALSRPDICCVTALLVQVTKNTLV